MKENATLILALAVSLSLKAQTIPNAGFETWVNDNETSYTYSVPQNWITTDIIETYYVGDTLSSVVKTTQSHSGQYAVLMQPSFSNDFGFVVGGKIFSGNLLSNNVFYGFPFTSRPASLEGYFKLTSVGGDVGQIVLNLTKWDTANNKRDTLFYTAEITNITPSVYTQFNIPITYTKNEYPDTASLQFGVVGIPNATHIGTQYFIDDISFAGNVSLSIEHLASSQEQITIYPNPNNGVFTIETSATKKQMVQIFDVNQKLVLKQMINDKANIDASNLNPGVYFINITDENGVPIKNDKLILMQQ